VLENLLSVANVPVHVPLDEEVAPSEDLTRGKVSLSLSLSPSLLPLLPWGKVSLSLPPPSPHVGHGLSLSLSTSALSSRGARSPRLLPTPYAPASSQPLFNEPPMNRPSFNGPAALHQPTGAGSPRSRCASP
jgi:hypothetical protein